MEYRKWQLQAVTPPLSKKITLFGLWNRRVWSTGEQSEFGGTHQDFDEGIDTKTFSQVMSSGAMHLPNFHKFDKPNHFADMNTSVDLEMIRWNRVPLPWEARRTNCIEIQVKLSIMLPSRGASTSANTR